MINFALVGCGHIAHKHAEVIMKARGANLYAVNDTNRNILQNFADRYGVRAYSELDDMLADPDIHAVCICTPSGLHAAIAVKAAYAGKHVVVEKPIAMTLADADAIIDACRSNRVQCAVVHPNRFRPAMIELKRALVEGQFGMLSHINATVRWNRDQAYYDQSAWRGTKALDGGVLMNQAIHQLDLILWLMGPVKEVKAMTATRLRRMESEDVGLAILEFESGALGLIEAAANIYPKNYEESISIFGEKGSAVVGGSTANWIRHWVFDSVSREQGDRLIGEIEGNPFGTNGHQRIIEDMADCVTRGRRPIVSGEDGRRALKLVLDIYRAAESRTPVLSESV